MRAERLLELRLDGGERLPIIKVEGAAPPVMPTVYAVSMLRSGGRSPNTIAEHLRAIMVARRWAAMRDMSLEEHMQAGLLLSEREIEDLVRALRARQRETPGDQGSEKQVSAPRDRRSGAEAFRRVPGATEAGVDPAVAAKRIAFVRDYLVWLARSARRPATDVEITRMAAALSSRAKVRSDTPSAPRRGLDADQRARLLALVNPSSSENPFVHPPTRIRNALIVRLLYATGARRGEIAGLKVRDIDPKAATIAIHRRGDDPDDPRSAPPRAKTAARVVPCDPALIHDLGAYVLGERRREPSSKRHPFLFVSHRGTAVGAPLSNRQIGKIFEALSAVLDFDVHAHLLRHTWNDRFSEMQDARPGPRAEAAEERVRGVLMGWSPQSKMPALYSKRHTERAAAKAMQHLSKGIVGDE